MTNNNETNSNKDYKNNETQSEYDALNFDGLERRANYRIITFREDMLQALDKNDAAATIYQIIWRWQTEVRKEEVLKEIARRKKLNTAPLTQVEAEDMMYAYMSYNDFVRETGGAVSYNTVIRTINRLVAAKIIFQKENHDPRYPDYEYSINKEVVRELLKSLPAMPFIAPKIPKKSRSTQMGIADTETENVEGSTQMGTGGIPKLVEGSTQMGTEVYPNGGTSHNYTHTTHITTNTEEDLNVVTNVKHPTLSLSLQEMIALLAENGYTILPSKTSASMNGKETCADENNSHSHDAHPLSTPPLQSGEISPNQRGDVTDHAGDTIQRSHYIATQNASFLPSEQRENATDTLKPSNDTPVTSRGSQRENEASQPDASEQAASYSQDIQQPPLAAEKPKRTRKPATEKPVQPEPDLSVLNEQELKAYAMLRSEDKPKYLAYSPAKRETYNNWLASYGFAVPVDITPKFDECLERIIQIHPTPDEFKNWRATIKKRDNEKLPEKRFFKNRSPQIWDVVRDVAALREDGQLQTPSQPTPIRSTMTKEEACNLANDIMAQGKKHNYQITAKADISKKDATIWVVRVDWPNEDGFTIPAMRSQEQWQEKFKEMHEVFSYVPRSMRGVM